MVDAKIKEDQETTPAEAVPPPSPEEQMVARLASLAGLTETTSKKSTSKTKS